MVFRKGPIDMNVAVIRSTITYYSQLLLETSVSVHHDCHMAHIRVTLEGEFAHTHCDTDSSGWDALPGMAVHCTVRSVWSVESQRSCTVEGPYNKSLKNHMVILSKFWTMYGCISLCAGQMQGVDLIEEIIWAFSFTFRPAHLNSKPRLT